MGAGQSLLEIDNPTMIAKLRILQHRAKNDPNLRKTLKEWPPEGSKEEEGFDPKHIFQGTNEEFRFLIENLSRAEDAKKNQEMMEALQENMGKLIAVLATEAPASEEINSEVQVLGCQLNNISEYTRKHIVDLTYNHNITVDGLKKELKESKERIRELESQGLNDVIKEKDEEIKELRDRLESLELPKTTSSTPSIRADLRQKLAQKMEKAREFQKHFDEMNKKTLALIYEEWEFDAKQLAEYAKKIEDLEMELAEKEASETPKSFDMLTDLMGEGPEKPEMPEMPELPKIRELGKLLESGYSTEYMRLRLGERPTDFLNQASNLAGPSKPEKPKSPEELGYLEEYKRLMIGNRPHDLPRQASNLEGPKMSKGEREIRRFLGLDDEPAKPTTSAEPETPSRAKILETFPIKLGSLFSTRFLLEHGILEHHLQEAFDEVICANHQLHRQVSPEELKEKIEEHFLIVIFHVVYLKITQEKEYPTMSTNDLAGIIQKAENQKTLQEYLVLNRVKEPLTKEQKAKQFLNVKKLKKSGGLVPIEELEQMEAQLQPEKIVNGFW